jgi:hypothetical protein
MIIQLEQNFEIMNIISRSNKYTAHKFQEVLVEMAREFVGC